MGQCGACGKHMPYREFEDHLAQRPACAKVVKELRDEAKRKRMAI